ncbi:hypothetical protein Tco_0819993 [Tanacetum coccineum]|uniref:Uncharacterized protein n=1 Tax=Tanacetum coccineum TaxID=301880 RepID=A0ABQ5ACV5_9ASTR
MLPRRSTVIRLRIPERRSTRLTPPALVPTVDKADEMILQDTLQVSLAEHKSREEQEARENVALVDEHLASEEIEKMVDGQENIVDDSSIPRNDEPNILGTRIEPRSNKESPEVEITKDKEVEITKETPVVEITNVVIPVNVNDDDEEITNEVYELKRREKGKLVELKQSTSIIVQDKTYSLQTLQELLLRVTMTLCSSCYNHATSSVPDQQYQLYLAMKADPQLQQQDIAIWLALQMKFERNTVLQTACRTPAVRPRDQDDPHDDAHPEGENSAKRQKTSEYEAYVSGESSSGQVFQEEQAPSTLGNQEQDDDFDFWTDSYASDDDEIPTKQVSQDIMEEVSLTIDEAKLRKMADEMLRQRCTSGDEHQYHIDQMKNFLKSDIVWESRKEILVSPHPRKTTPLVHSCQKDPEAPALSLINQDLLYLKKGNSGPEKIVLSLHKFPAIIFNDDDIEERTSRWVNKCVKKFNPYARYGVEHWKNPHAKIFYIRKQKEPGKSKEELFKLKNRFQVHQKYRNWGTPPDYKNLNKTILRNIYLCDSECQGTDYADTGYVSLLSVFIRNLTENQPSKFHSFHRFWQTASASTFENEEMEITGTIDERVKTVTEASIRRHLKLEDSDVFDVIAQKTASATTTETYIAPKTLTQKLFGNMRMISKGYNGVDIPLFPTMLVQGPIFQGERSIVPVESHHPPTSAPSTTQPPTSPPSMQTTHVAEEVDTMPHDSPLLRVHSLGSDEVKKKMENIIKSSKARRRARLIVLEDEDDLEDPSKQGRKIAQLDEDEGITLVQIGAQTQGRHEHDLEPDFEFTTPEEVYTAEPDISTDNVPVSTAGAEVSTAGAEVSTASPEVKTAAESLEYIRRSAAKRKIKLQSLLMKEAEPVQKKTKLQLEQERLRFEEALRLQEPTEKEERKRIARVHEEVNTFNAEEWDNIQAQIEADEEVSMRIYSRRKGKSLKLRKQDCL